MTASSIIAIIIFLIAIGLWLTLVIWGGLAKRELPEWLTKPWKKKK